VNETDRIYQDLIEQVLKRGDLIETRNHSAYSLIFSESIWFNETPLVTVRKTAWKKALREMEWFLSGDIECPNELLDWWRGQLDPDGEYLCGYGHQLRRFFDIPSTFDQIAHLIEGLKHHPYSRRHVITTWNPSEMSKITKINDNPNTPSTCHGTILQYFVRNVKLHVSHYQRSCDILLGAIHNFIQHWALLMWLAKQTGLEVGSMRWLLGDAHVYDESSHIEVANAIVNCNLYERTLPPPTLVYHGAVGDEFKASDFEMVGEIDVPVITTRPRLL